MGSSTGPFKYIYIMEDEFALKYYNKLFVELDIWEQRHIIVLQLHEVANFVTAYFLIKINVIAKSEREFYTNFAILCNCCCAMVLLNINIINYKNEKLNYIIISD